MGFSVSGLDSKTTVDLVFEMLSFVTRGSDQLSKRLKSWFLLAGAAGGIKCDNPDCSTRVNQLNEWARRSSSEVT